MLHAKASARTTRSAVTSAEVLDAQAVLLVPAVRLEVAPAVRPAAVDIGEPVRVGEPARAGDRAAPALGVGAGRERRDASGDVGGRLRDRETGTVAAGVPPVLLADAEVLEHLLRAEPAGRDADDRDRLVLELGRETLDDAFHVRLHEVVVEADVPPELGVRLRGAEIGR